MSGGGSGLRQAQIDMTQFNIHFVIFFSFVQIFEVRRGKKPTETRMNQ